MAYAGKRNGTWWVRWPLPQRAAPTKAFPKGRPKEGYADGFATKTAALKHGRDQEAAIRAGTWIDPNLGKTPIADWFERWFNAADFVPNTRETYLRHWTRHIQPRWGHVELAEPRAIDFDEWRTKLRADGLSESTINGIFSVLRGLYDSAVLNRMIYFSPFPPKKRGRRQAAVAPVAKREGVVVPLDVLEKIMLRLRHVEMLLVLCALFTGMRWSEVAAMRRTYLRLDPGDPAAGRPPSGTYTLDPAEGAVHELPSGRRYLGPPKSGPGRVFDLPAFLVLLLYAYLQTLPDGQDILFPDSKGDYRRHDGWNKGRWRPACDGRPAAVTPKGRVREAITPLYPGLWLHDLKHTHAALLREGRVAEVMIDYRLGHVRPGAPGVYANPSPQMRQEVVDCLDRVWAQWSPTQLIDELMAWLRSGASTKRTSRTRSLLAAPRALAAEADTLF
jgi:integrase